MGVIRFGAGALPLITIQYFMAPIKSFSGCMLHIFCIVQKILYGWAISIFWKYAWRTYYDNYDIVSGECVAKNRRVMRRMY